MIHNSPARLELALEFATPEMPNYKLESWPPPADFPIIIDAKGNVVSYYLDNIWILTPWKGTISSINFCDGEIRKNSKHNTSFNADILRQLAASWLYFPGGVKAANTFLTRFMDITPIFKFASTNNVNITDLYRFPLLISEFAASISSSRGPGLLTLIHDVWERRELLGFYILDTAGLQILSQEMPIHLSSQTPYIPPRIWEYQIARLREGLQDFLAHRSQIEACYQRCLELYAQSCGSLAEACRNPSAHRNPFSSKRKSQLVTDGHLFDEDFARLASSFGIKDVIEKWRGPISRSPGALSEYFALMTIIGTAYILCFSMMRVDEVNKLRTNCLTVEKIEDTGDELWILRGETTKTLTDDDACWITSPSVIDAVEALSCISRLRMIAADVNPEVPTTSEDISTPYLISRAYEPWRAKSHYIPEPLSIRPTYQSYSHTISRQQRKLYCYLQLKITKSDLRVALLITPSLDITRYAVGKVWPLNWHQLRRTGAVNMAASDMVSDLSIQYQMKHRYRMSTKYYMTGHFNLGFPINSSSRTELIKAMYECIALEFIAVRSEAFVSPHGEKRKGQILNITSLTDFSKLLTAAEQGKITCKPTILGACTNPRPCPYGGIEYIARCGGGDDAPPCEHALYRRDKLPVYIKLRESLTKSINAAPPNSPLHASLIFQLKAVENAINVVSQ